MGCCEARGLTKGGKTKSGGFGGGREGSVLESEEDEGLSSDELLRLKGGKPLDLLDKYLGHLLSLNTWNTLINKEGIVIKTIEGSVFTKSIPVVLGRLTFECEVPHGLLCGLIENNEDLAWDSSVGSCTVVDYRKGEEGFRVVRKFSGKKQKTEKRVFIVKRYFYEAAGSLNYLSVNEDLGEEDLSVEKGWCHFSLVKIRDRKGKTLISQVFQIDSLQESNAYLNHVSGNELYEWLQKLRVTVLKLI